MDVPPFLIAASHRKWESFENRVFQMTMLKEAMDGFFQQYTKTGR
jgi:hypothetical protein